MNICIVIPALNGADYIASSLASILSQDGHFHLRLHVQDGGSTDATREIAQAVIDRFLTMPGFRRSVETTMVSEKDNGIYGAVALGFEKLSPKAGDVMTWLGVDDVLAANALATVAEVFREHEDIDWVSGSPQLFSREQGMMSYHNGSNYALSPFSLRNGWNDGRTFGFLQQEGCFWRARLWQKAGGIRTDRRHVGDWDLWRRFASFSPMYRLVGVNLGQFGVRANQSSSDISGYYAEMGPRTRFSREGLCSEVSAEDPASKVFCEHQLVRSSLDEGWRRQLNPLEPCVVSRSQSYWALPEERIPVKPLWGDQGLFMLSAATDGSYFLAIDCEVPLGIQAIVVKDERHPERTERVELAQLSGRQVIVFAVEVCGGNCQIGIVVEWPQGGRQDGPLVINHMVLAPAGDDQEGEA